MKKLYNTISAIAILVISASCEHASYLDLVPPTQTVPANYYKTETHFRLATIGVYEALNTRTAAGVSVEAGTYFGGLLGIMSGPSDEVLPSRASTQNRVTDMFSASYLESNPSLRAMWDACYIGINRCNSIIENGRDINSAVINSYICEAKFMRGLYYWYLAQIFGGVPVAVYGSDGMQPRKDLETIYTGILRDMKEAYAGLGVRGTGANGNASANKYTAAAYIGKICNYLAACANNHVGKELLAEQPLNSFEWVNPKQMSDTALVYLEEVVNESGYKLTDDFRNLFRETTKMQQHEECLLMAENYFTGSENEFPSTQTFMFSPSSSGTESKGQSPQLYFGYILPSPRIFGIYSPDDPRRDWFFTCSEGDVTQTAPVTAKVETVDGVRYHIPFNRARATKSWTRFYDSPEQTYQPWDVQWNAAQQDSIQCEATQGCVGKYRFAIVGQGFSNHDRNHHSLSLPLMRFAEVKLMYAEALYFSKKDEGAARAQMTDVLKRACGGNQAMADSLAKVYKGKRSGVYPADAFVDELLDARERELCFEGSRKFDLIRFNCLNSAIEFLATENPEKPGYYGYNSYSKFNDGEVVFFHKELPNNYKVGGEALTNNWKPYKIWAPISKVQIEATNNILTQNAQW